MRGRGYYWVRHLGGEWFPAKWTGRGWEVAGVSGVFADSVFAEVGEQVRRGDER